MFAQSEVQCLKVELTNRYNSFPDKIVEKTGISRVTIYKFFNGQRIRPANAEKVYKAAVELLKDKIDKQKALTDKVHDLIQTDQQTIEAITRETH